MKTLHIYKVTKCITRVHNFLLLAFCTNFFRKLNYEAIYLCFFSYARDGNWVWLFVGQGNCGLFYKVWSIILSLYFPCFFLILGHFLLHDAQRRRRIRAARKVAGSQHK